MSGGVPVQDQCVIGPMGRCGRLTHDHLEEDPEWEGPDQPPELDPEPEPGDLPPPERAAERVREFLSSFGDGLVMHTFDDLPLFARDLEALAQLSDRILKAMEHAVHQQGVTQFATSKAWKRQFDILYGREGTRA